MNEIAVQTAVQFKGISDVGRTAARSGTDGEKGFGEILMLLAGFSVNLPEPDGEEKETERQAAAQQWLAGMPFSSQPFFPFQEAEAAAEALSGESPGILPPDEGRTGIFRENAEMSCQAENWKPEKQAIDSGECPITFSSRGNAAESPEQQFPFEKLLQQVRKMPVGRIAEEKRAPVDAEALQQTADAFRGKMTAQVKGESTFLRQEVNPENQIREQVFEHLSKGDREFVMKLKPESLGEIVVKMQEKDGKLSLSILTASTQTAKLLNESSETLKAALRPIQAEIKEILPRPESSETAGRPDWPGSDSFRQNHFSGQRQPEWQQKRKREDRSSEDWSLPTVQTIRRESGEATYI